MNPGEMTYGAALPPGGGVLRDGVMMHGMHRNEREYQASRWHSTMEAGK